MSAVPTKLVVLVPLVAAGLLTILWPSSPVTDRVPVTEQEMEMPAPGAEHKWLAEGAGKWDLVTRFKMTPEAPWMESKGTNTCTMVCGGFWQQCVHKGTMMGMPFEGRMQLGYDQHKKKFVGTWIDNFGSYQSVMEGSLSADKKVLTMHSDMLDPQSGKSMKVRMETHFLGKDKTVFKMFMPGADGKDFMTMEQTSTRAK